MKTGNYFYRNSLSIVFLLLFFFSLVGQSYTGWHEHNDFLHEYGLPSTSFWMYIISGHFLQATFENWESEFFQMGLFVVLTIWLRQKGSSESEDFEPEPAENELIPKPNSPRAVKKGGLYLAFYKNSLSYALFALVIFSFFMHGYGSWLSENEELLLEGKHGVGFWDHTMSSRFWFESFQNWQSEFLSVLTLVFLSIYLRQQGSPQSKKVNDPHTKTGP